MTDKVYTAQEMRDTLKCMYVNMIVGTRGLYCAVNSNDVIAMLRYAAEVVGRCEDLLARLRPYRDEDVIGTINYILRGNAENGGEK